MSNKLIIGLADKTEEMIPKPGFLLIDNGPIADAFLKTFKRAKQFDPYTHSFNPLPMDDVEARAFADIVFGDAGKDTLRVRDGKRALTRLLTKARRLDELEAGKGDDEKEAVALIEDLLLSPVLRRRCVIPLRGGFAPEPRSSHALTAQSSASITPVFRGRC